jgi:hypothetical protein
MNSPHKRFFWVLLISFGGILMPIFVLNLILLNDTLGNTRKVLLASQWQQQTHGVTYAPTLSDTHLFKTLRLNDRLPEINTVVFGSSTALGITGQDFPDTLHLYNYAQTGNPLSAVIGEAEYIQQHASNVKWLIIPLDWSLGFIYQTGSPPDADLSPTTTMNQTQTVTNPVPLTDKMRDALSYPRISSLFEILSQIRRTNDKIAAFRGYFMQDGSNDYRCTDGTPGKDFDTIHRGTCTGFRFDGSATFANSARVDNASALISTALSSNSQYYKNLLLTEGLPNPIFLQRLADLDKRSKANGGGVILFMPPLLPGMEAEFLRHPQLSSALLNTQQSIGKWSKDNNLVVLDAGQSEKFACLPDEFLDQHHATSTCYNKIFHQFWLNAPRPDSTIAPPTNVKK